MDRTLETLPVEMRTSIFKQCRQQDLPNIALCCRGCRDDVTLLIWEKLGMPWTRLEKTVISTPRFKLITELVIGGEIRQREGYSNYSFSLLMHSLDPQRLKKITLDDDFFPDGLRLISETIPMLQGLNLYDVPDHINIDWSFMVRLEQLTELCITQCLISLTEIAMICGLKQLKDLSLYVIEFTDVIGDGPYHHSNIAMPKMDQLVKLVIDGEGKMMEAVKEMFISKNGPFFKNLEDLDLICYCPVSDADLFYIYQLCSLQRLSIYICNDEDGAFTDVGLRCISNLKALKYLKIEKYICFTDISVRLFSV